MTGRNTKNVLKAGLASMALFAAYPALAQTGTTAPAEPMAPATTPMPAEPAAPAAPATGAAPAAGASNFTESDIKQFAAAAVEVTKIQQDTAIPAAEKQPKMLAAVQASGLPPEKFNQIGQAAAADPALQQRIQAAAPAAPAASAAPAAPASPGMPGDAGAAAPTQQPQ